MGWRERRDSKRSGCDKYGVRVKGQEKKMELGGELGEEGDRDKGCIRLQDSSEQCQNALQCMFVSLPLARGQYSCSGTVLIQCVQVYDAY